jgi:hypothetical protein
MLFNLLYLRSNPSLSAIPIVPKSSTTKEALAVANKAASIIFPVS